MSTPTIKKLNKNDIKKLKKQQRQLFFFLVLFLSLFGSIVYFLFQKLKFNNKSELLIIGFLALFFIIFVIIILAIYKRLYNDILNNKKHCFKGIIEDKTTNISNSNKNKTKINYYITLNGNQHLIDFKSYVNCSVSDLVYFEKTPKLNILLCFSVIKNGADLLENTLKKTFKVTQHEAPLRHQDIDVIRQLFKKKAITKLHFIVLPFFISIGLIVNKMHAFLWFLFPIPIILLYQCINIIKLYFQYQKALQYRKKNITTHLVIDKVTTFRSYKSYNKIKTTKSVLQVPNSLFNNIKINDKIQVHIPQHFNFPIAFTHKNNIYYLKIR